MNRQVSRNKIEDEDIAKVASLVGIPVSEVRRMVNSFFDIIIRESRNLPFDNSKRIYTKERFEDLVSVRNIPFMGRIGPVYSRYLKWRGNDAKNLIQVKRRNCRAGISQSEIENMAEEILSGKTPSPVKKRRISQLYDRIWIVGRAGKKLARQAIPKEMEKDGI